MKSSIRKGFVPKYSYHVITWLIVIVALVFKQGSFGKDPYGICSMKVGVIMDNRLVGVFHDLIFATISLLIGVFIACFVLIYTQIRLPHFGKDMNHMKRDFLNYYKTYIKACIIVWIIVFLSFVSQIFGEDQRIKIEEDQNYLG